MSQRHVRDTAPANPHAHSYVACRTTRRTRRVPSRSLGYLATLPGCSQGLADPAHLCMALLHNTMQQQPNQLISHFPLLHLMQPSNQTAHISAAPSCWALAWVLACSSSPSSPRLRPLLATLAQWHAAPSQREKKR